MQVGKKRSGMFCAALQGPGSQDQANRRYMAAGNLPTLLSPGFSAKSCTPGNITWRWGTSGNGPKWGRAGRSSPTGILAAVARCEAENASRLVPSGAGHLYFQVSSPSCSYRVCVCVCVCVCCCHARLASTRAMCSVLSEMSNADAPSHR